MGQRVFQSHSFQLSPAIGKKREACADLAQRVDLFEDSDIKSPANQRVGGTQATYAGADNCDSKAIVRQDFRPSKRLDGQDTTMLTAGLGNVHNVRKSKRARLRVIP